MSASGRRAHRARSVGGAVFALALLTLAGVASAADAPAPEPAAPATPAPPSAPPVAPAPPPAPAAPGAAKPPRPLTPERAADAVLAAVVAKDEAALRALAAKDDPDPWLVADELIRRGEFDVADAFARAAPRVDTEALPGYVASRRGKPDDPARRERLSAVETAFLARDFARALAALGPLEPDPVGDVVGVRLRTWLGNVLYGLGRSREAAAAYVAAGDAAERLGWLVMAGGEFWQSGLIEYGAEESAAAREAWTRCLAVCERRGDQRRVARTTGNLGSVHLRLGNYAEALSLFERSLRSREAMGDRVGTARSLVGLGAVHDARGDLAAALSYYDRALEEYEALEDKEGAALTLSNAANVHLGLGDPTTALSLYRRALTAREALGDEAGAARVLIGMGNVHYARGHLKEARSHFERALATLQALGDRSGVVAALGNMAALHLRFGDYAKALSLFEREAELKEALGDKAGVVTTLGNIGVVHEQLGEYGKALSLYMRSLAGSQTIGDRVGAATALTRIGNVHRLLGEHERGLSFLSRALTAQEAMGDKAVATRTMAIMAMARGSMGDDESALLLNQRALEAFMSLGDEVGAAQAMVGIGDVHHARGDFERALAAHSRAHAALETLGDGMGRAGLLGAVARDHTALGDYAEAVAFARRAVAAQTRAARGLAAEEGMGARAPHGFVYDVGAEASVALADAGQLSFFVESGRAGALLEGLSAREALVSAAVPEALRAEEARARAAETRAVAALRKALDGGDLAATKARRAELEAAQGQVSAIVSRIPREAKAGAAIVYPEAATLDEIRATLETGDALVLYALFEKDAVALVVEHGGARIVKLGLRAPIDAAAEAVAEALADDASDPKAALTALADLVVKPLGLGEGTKRVLVSPTGLLSYVPFAALTRDRTVAYVPSGTTYRLLREEEALRGEGVLALGDPDYETKIDERALAVNRGAAGKLVRLPATRDEALAVGTTTLLGADATEAGLRKALAERKRWRAVHLACHGLVNTERPALSSLAITAAGDDDGFLTCLDVFRMKVPADLVVLSACETGKGKVVKGEGIVGLTRAFMFAGSPRVLCSLWKVDDAATAALMTKFYDLWNPKTGSKGMGTAEALRAAQEHVRSQEKWKHPYYWAAWVLWGLPS